MGSLTIKNTISVTYSADDWELFDEPGRDEAAAALNKALEEAVNAPGSTLSTIYKAMDVVQMKYSQLGAADSEATRLIDHVLRKVFPDEDI